MKGRCAGRIFLTITEFDCAAFGWQCEQLVSFKGIDEFIACSCVSAFCALRVARVFARRRREDIVRSAMPDILAMQMKTDGNLL